MASVSVLSNVACAGGTVVRRIVDWQSLTYGESLAGDEGCTLVLPNQSDTIADCTVRAVLSVVDTGITTEYRILRVDDDLNTPTTTVTATPILHDLGRAPLSQTLAGLQTFALATTSLTITQWIDNYILPSLVTNGISWVARGIVIPTGLVTASYTRQTPLGLLRSVVANSVYELQLRRNGTTNYLIDVVVIDKTNGINPVAFVGRNVTARTRSQDGDRQYTVIVPTGVTPAGDTRASGIEQTAFAVHTTPSGATVKIKDAKNTSAKALQVDGQLSTSYAEILPPPVVPQGNSPWMTATASVDGFAGENTSAIWKGIVGGTSNPGRQLSSVVYNTVNAKFYLFTVEADSGAGSNWLVVWRIDPTTMQYDAKYIKSGVTFPAPQWRTIGFSPSGTAGTLLIYADDSPPTHVTARAITFDCNAGTFSTEATLGYTKNAGELVDHPAGVSSAQDSCGGGVATWMVTPAAWLVCYCNNGGTGNMYTVHITAASPPVFTNYGPHFAGSAPAQNYINAMPLYCTSGNRVLMWVGGGVSAWKVYNPSVQTFANPTGLTAAAPEWMWYDPVATVAVIGVTSTNRIEWYNASSDTVPNTLADTTAVADWHTLALQSVQSMGAYDAVGNRYLYMRTANLASTQQWYQIDLTNHTKTLATGMVQGIANHPMGTTNSDNYYGGFFLWYDTARKLVWQHYPGGAFVGCRPMTSAPFLAQLTASVADDGSGVSTITPDDTGLFKDTGYVVAANPSSGVQLEMRRDSSRNLPAEMPNASAIATYGRIVGFADASRYGYRGEHQLFYDPLHRDTLTTDTWVKHPHWHRPGRAYGDRGHFLSSHVVARASHPLVAAAESNIKCNGAATGGAYTVALKGFAANRWVPLWTRITTPWTATYVQADVQADGSGNVTVALILPLSAGAADNTAVTLVIPNLAVPTWGVAAEALVNGVGQGATVARVLVVPWLPARTTLRVTAWVSHFHPVVGAVADPGTITMRILTDRTNTDVLWSGTFPANSSTTAAVANLTLTQTITEAQCNHPLWVSLTPASAPTFVLWGISAYLGTETVSEPFEQSYANDLWQYGANILNDSSSPPIAYRVGVLEDDPAAPFALGGTVLLRDPERGIAATPRIVAVTRSIENDNEVQTPVAPTIDLDNRPQSLIQTLVDKGSV
jgi:hypothetical protein